MRTEPWSFAQRRASATLCRQDALEKDVGFFNGPLPTLLSDTCKDDLSMLLFGSDPAHSQIEFGAHQVAREMPHAPCASYMPMQMPMPMHVHKHRAARGSRHQW